MTYQPPEDSAGAPLPPETPAQPYAAPGAPAYGAPPAYGYALPEHPQATTILVLGILALVFGGVTGPFAWYMGSKARKEIAAGQYAPSSSVTAGWIMGIVGSAYLILVAAIIVFSVIAAIGFVAASS